LCSWFVDALSNAVDPAEAACYFYRFGPGHARFSGTFFVEADELLAELVMMGFEPDAEVCGRAKECRSWWHGAQPDVDGQGDPTIARRCLNILHTWLKEKRVKPGDTESAENRKRTDRNFCPTGKKVHWRRRRRFWCGRRCRVRWWRGHEGHVVERREEDAAVEGVEVEEAFEFEIGGSGGFAAVAGGFAAKVYSARAPRRIAFQGGRWRGDFPRHHR